LLKSPAATARLQEARRIEHDRSDAGLQKETSQPETVIADLIADRELE
jgi:hypothetical protein